MAEATTTTKTTTSTTTTTSDADRLGWSLATESIVVKIRWFGIFMGVWVLVEARSGLHNPVAVTACLSRVGAACYAVLDTLAYWRGTVFLRMTGPCSSP